MKRILKILGITILVLLLVIIVSPFLFKDKLEDLLKKNINDNLNATVSWKSLDISLLTHFPKATVSLNDFLVTNHAPFEGDTLAMGKDIKIDMGIKQLFKKTISNPINIDALQLDEALIQLKINEEGVANYDISKASKDSVQAVAKENEASEPFSFALEHYEINKTTLNYSDETSKTFFALKDFNHEGNGDFSALQSTLDTKTSGDVSLEIGGANYVNGQHIQLDAAIGLDLENQKYTFKENKATLNKLPLTFDGFVQLKEETTVVDISLATPESSFKNFLAVIPDAYSKNLDGVDTSGDFRVSGKIKGNVTDTTIPTLDVSILSKNASFKFPDLPKRMEGINIDTRILNTTGISDDTYVMINQLNFKIDDDFFSTEGSLKKLTTNMLVDLALKGKLNLANIEKVYPLNLKEPLKGIVNADFTTRFDMASVENHSYNNIKSSGVASLSGFTHTTEELPKPITITNASVNFKPGIIELTKFSGKTGDTDINAKGSIENLIPFVMSKEDLKGRFDITSDVFNLNDFSVEEVAVENTNSTASRRSGQEEVSTIKIPDFLDAALNFNAKKVIYDDLTLEDMKGSMTIREEQANLSNLTSSIFGGEAGLAGNVSTKDDIPVFDMKLDLSKIDIKQSLDQLPLLQSLAPIAKALQGAMSTTINITGQLDENLAPILSTVAGNAVAKVQNTEVNTGQVPLVSSLNEKLSFIDLKGLNLNDLAASLQFKEGKVIIKPFNLNIKGIQTSIAGSHSFDNILDYALSLDVPAKYLGNDVSGLLAKLTREEKESLHVPLPITLTGNMTKPNININTKSAISNLTSQIIEIQKQHLKDKGNDIINDVIDDIVSDKVGGDAGEVIKDVIGGVIGGNTPKTIDNSPETTDDTSKPNEGEGGLKKTPPTTTIPKADEVIKDAANDILGGLFGNKKKRN